MKYKQWYYRKIQLAYVTSTAVHLAWSESCAQILWPMPSWAATHQDRFRAWSFQRCCTGGLERSSTAPAGKWNSCVVQDGIEDLALSGGLRSGEMTKLRPVLSHRRASDSPCDSCARYKFDWLIGLIDHIQHDSAVDCKINTKLYTKSHFFGDIISWIFS